LIKIVVSGEWLVIGNFAETAVSYGIVQENNTTSKRQESRFYFFENPMRLTK